MTVAEPKMVEVFRAKNLAEAHAIRMYLSEAGVNAFIDGEHLQGVVGELPMGWATAPRILVEEMDAAQAREAVKVVEGQMLSRIDAPDGLRCLSCGKAMSENDATCTACGWSFLDGVTTESKPGVD